MSREDIKKDLVKDMSSSSFSLMFDGSNDARLEKMFPIGIRIFDVTLGRKKDENPTRKIFTK